MDSAVLQCVLICASYVGSVEACRRLVKPSERDAPRQVLARSVAVTVVSLVAWRTLRAGLRSKGREGEIVDLLGLRAEGIPYGATFAVASCVSLLLAVAVARASRRSSWLPNVRTPSLKLAFARDVLIAPAAEEFCFRGCMCAILTEGGLGLAPAALLTSALFGLSHLVHLSEAGAARTAAAVCYTTLFGLYACRVLFHTRSLPACWTAHAVANFLGPPDLGRAAGSAFYTTTTALGLAVFSALMWGASPRGR